MTTLIAAYGYIDRDDDIGRWQANGIVEQPGELLEWLTDAPMESGQ
jgi:hypothetical protein